MKPLRIDIEMYDQVIYFGDSLKAIEKRLVKDGLKDPRYQLGEDLPEAGGFVKMTGNKEKAKWIKILVVKDGKPSTLAHEVCHVCIEITKDMHEGDVFHAQEQFSYMLGYIFGKCFEHMFE